MKLKQQRQQLEKDVFQSRDLIASVGLVRLLQLYQAESAQTLKTAGGDHFKREQGRAVLLDELLAVINEGPRTITVKPTLRPQGEKTDG